MRPQNNVFSWIIYYFICYIKSVIFNARPYNLQYMKELIKFCLTITDIQNVLLYVLHTFGYVWNNFCLQTEVFHMRLWKWPTLYIIVFRNVHCVVFENIFLHKSPQKKNLTMSGQENLEVKEIQINVKLICQESDYWVTAWTSELYV